MADNTDNPDQTNPALEMSEISGEIPPPPMSPGIPYPDVDTDEVPPSIDDLEIPPPPDEPPPPIPEDYVEPPTSDLPTRNDGVDDTPPPPAETPPSPPLEETTPTAEDDAEPPADDRVEEDPPPPETLPSDEPSRTSENQFPSVDEVPPPPPAETQTPTPSYGDYQGEMDDPPPQNVDDVPNEPSVEEVPPVSEDAPPPPPILLNGTATPPEPDEVPNDTTTIDDAAELTAEESLAVASVVYADNIESEPQDLTDGNEMNSAISYANTLPSNQPTASANAHAEPHTYVEMGERKEPVKHVAGFRIEAVVWMLLFTLLAALVAGLLYFVYSFFDAQILPNEPLRARITLTLSNQYLPGYAISTHRDYRTLEAKFITGVNETFTSQNSEYATVYEGAEIFFFANGSIRTSFHVNLSRPLSTSMRRSALIDDIMSLLPIGFTMEYFQDLELVPDSITVSEVYARSQGSTTGSNYRG